LQKYTHAADDCEEENCDGSTHSLLLSDIIVCFIIKNSIFSNGRLHDP
jgi:hypothetical protein